MSLNSISKTSVDVSIIIVNYNLTKEIENCINSLILNVKSSSLKFEIIIVDNNSTDKDIFELEKKIIYKNIFFYYLNKNLGFGKGCNYGFSKASGEFICFLNPDTLIRQDIFSPIMNLLQSDQSIGVIAPKQQTKTRFFDFSAGFYPNIFFELFNLFGLGVFLEGFILKIYTKFKGKKYFEIDWILGAAIFIRAELFKTINGFDEDYFMFFEEVDLCKRISSKGFKIIYYPHLKVDHLGSVSGKKDYSLYTIRTYSSKYIYMTKHYKSLYKFIMQFLLFTQLFSQIIIWTILFPLKSHKSKQKINGFVYLLKHKMRLT